VWNRDGRPADAAILRSMSQTLSHRSPDGEDMLIAGAVGFAHQHLWVTLEEIGERQPLASDRGTLIVFDGRLDNREELDRLLDLPAGTSDATCALAAYEQWHENFVERLVGDFALGVFDPVRQRLVLGRDALGVRPLCYHATPTLIAFASEIKALLAHPTIPAEPDEEGLADSLMLRVRPVDGLNITCFKGISSLEPSHVLVATRDDVQRRKYWDFDGATRLELKTFDEYADAFRERFATAVRRRMRSAFPIAVSVSGGLDSSSIFCQADKLRRGEAGLAPDLAGISYIGVGTADEREFLDLVEQATGISIDRIPLDDHLGVVDGALGQLWHVETPTLDYLWRARVAIAHGMRERGARVLLSGHWGDQMLFSRGYLVDLARRFNWRELRSHLREYPRWLDAGEANKYAQRLWPEVAHSLVPDSLRAPLKRARRWLSAPAPVRWFADDFISRARRSSDAPAHFDRRFHSVQAKRIYLQARSAYHVQSMEWNNKAAAIAGHDHAFPFLDRDLIALLIAMPGTMQNRGGVPRAVLREGLRGVLPDAIRARTWKADFSGAVNTGVARDFQAIAAYLTRDSQAVARGYFDAGRLEPEIARLGAAPMRDDCSDSWDLADAFGFELWLRVFFAHAASGQKGPRTPSRIE
jgi:asparagine synthase (glutamine-hydrolysing)